MDNKNEIKVYTTSNGAELNISAPSTKQVISATNNRAQYFAEQAKKYRDEAKLHRDNAKYYAEQNSDVTFEYIDSVRATLEDKIATKQDNGNYALKEELPVKVSELENDAQYVVKSEFDSVTQALELPSQEGCAGKFLMSDGEKESWVGINSFQLFDTVLKDHVLTYEESKGLALQGTYVYKNAVAGSRYGYPDFYAKCLEEYSNSNNTYEVLQNNYEVVGSPTITDNGIASGFSISPLNRIAQSFDISAKENITIECGVIYKDDMKGATFAFDNSTRLFVGYQTVNLWTDSATNVIPVTNYLTSMNVSNGDLLKVKLILTNNTAQVIVSVKNQTFATNIKTSNIPLNITFIHFGASDAGVFTGSIDLKQFSITVDGKEVYRAVDYITANPNGHRFYPISSKTLIDSTYEQTGMAWFYGIDTENERIFLPRNNYFDQVTGDVSEVGQSVEAGLPNITGQIGASGWESQSASGAFKIGAQSSPYGSGHTTNSPSNNFDFDASKSNPIYGNSDTVQPNAVKKLLYICVGNTVSQSTITDVVDVTTTENDTIPLLTGMYFDFTPNNISWVKAGEQRNSGGVYTFCYNELVNELTNPKYDIKVVEIKNMIAGIDYSEYWKVNQDDMTFATPTAISGIVAEQATSQLYFKVANAVQNLELMDVARIEATKANKTDVDGQWIGKELIVSEAIAIGDYTLDLSDYLPNDGYMYEVWGLIYLSRGGDSGGTNTNVYIYDGFGERGRIAHTMADGANFQQNSNGFLLTVDTERKMRVEIADLAAAACVVYLFKYRRLGTNQ